MRNVKHILFLFIFFGTKLALAAKPFPNAGHRESVEVSAVSARQGFIVAAFADGNESSSSCAYTVSHSDGKKWSRAIVRKESGSDLGINPMIAVDNSGNIYAICLEGKLDPYSSFIELAVSRDHGRTWSPWSKVISSPRDGSGILDKPAILVSGRGEIFLSFTEITFVKDEDGNIVNFKDRLLTMTSRNGGKTWHRPVLISDRNDSHSADAPGPQGSALAIDGQQRLYVSWANYWGPVYLATSDDHARTFSQPVQISDEQMNPPVTSLTVDHSGHNVVVAWNTAHYFVAPVKVSASADGGRSWSLPIKLAEVGSFGTTALMQSKKLGLLWTQMEEKLDGHFIFSTKSAVSVDWLKSPLRVRKLSHSDLTNVSPFDFFVHVGAYQSLVPLHDHHFLAIYPTWSTDQTSLLYRRIVPGWPSGLVPTSPYHQSAGTRISPRSWQPVSLAIPELTRRRHN